MKRANSILSGSKLWVMIKDIMAAINSGRRPVQDVFRTNDFSTSTRSNYLDLIARSNSIR